MTLAQPVQTVLSHYARRAAGYVERSDLEQAAAEVVLEIERKGWWRPERGPLGTFQAGAVAKRLFSVVRDARNPVPNRRGAMFERAPVDAADHMEHPTGRGIEWRLDMQAAVAEVRRILEDHGPAAREVLLGEEKPRDVARTMGLAPRQVYRQTTAARAAIAGSRVLRKLMEHRET